MLAVRVDELVAALAPEAGTDDCLRVIGERDGLRRQVSTYRALVSPRFQQDTAQAGPRLRPRWPG